MDRWLRVLLGPLPATVLLLPLLFAGGLGSLLALIASLVDPGRPASERWASVLAPALVVAWVAAAGVGVVALWIVVLVDEALTLRRTPTRWWLAGALGLGLLAAGRWLWLMGMGGHRYDHVTWGLWLALLTGPLVLGGYYLVQLVRGGASAA